MQSVSLQKHCIVLRAAFYELSEKDCSKKTAYCDVYICVCVEYRMKYKTMSLFFRKQ